MSKSNTIPPITEPMGRYWNQPNPNNILVDDTHVLMSKEDFDELGEYSCSQPSGVYPGKMWKSNSRDGKTWYLKWFGIHEDPKLCSGNARIILIV